MNDNRKIQLILLIFIFINLSTEIFTLIYYVWMTKAIKIAFIIFFCLNILIYIFLSLIILEINIKVVIVPFAFLLYFMNNVIYLIILSINLGKFIKYWKYCPYLIKDFDYSLHFERRCELYNINNNSRYLYQYICSYDSSKDFKKKNLKNEIKIDNIICIPVKEIKDNEYNEVKNLFIDEYKNVNNYYCSRTNIPKNYSFVNHKNCKKAKYFLNIALYIITLIFEGILFFISFILLILYMISHLPPNIRRSHLTSRQINLSNNENNIERIFNNERNRDNIDNSYGALVNELNRLRDLFGNLRNNNNHFNNNSQLNNDTKESENPYMDNSFIKQKTRNIIVENKQEYSIETNIKNIVTNKDNKKFNVINLEEINIQIENNEKNELRNNS